ncbi:MAG: hypothetical protein KF708_15375 [Pirellulales bacterium]|nr:hypothetical protein [Pirellulales bacterium]
MFRLRLSRPSDSFERAACSLVLSWVAVGLFGTLPVARGADGPSRPPDAAPLLEDARLADIHFVDPQQGWAVGDRGVVWHTRDAGQTWQRQESGVNCPLTAVHFLDAQTGWIAGRFTEPYTQNSRGVMLRTRDGGATWQRDPKLMLPGLTDVGFFDLMHGWATGDASAFFPSGVYVTDDGGRTWMPLAGTRFTSWNAGSFVDPGTGIIVGRSATAAVISQRAPREVTLPTLGLRGVKRVRHANASIAWAVAEGAKVLRTEDAGATWRPVLDETTSVGIAAAFDFNALAVLGNECWVAGNPGTRVFHSPDGGQSWTSHATGHWMPLEAITFVDSQHGWAAGSLGSIIATSDGGRTWRSLRRGGIRVAVAGIFGDTADVPLVSLARLSGDEGFLSSVAILSRRDVGIAGLESSDPQWRTQEALVRVGASDINTNWAFPAREVELRLTAERLVEGWNRANDGHGLALLERHLVRYLRTVRPDVVLTHGAATSGDDPRSHLLNQMVLRAIDRAGDANSYKELAAHADLGAWQVKKVYGRMRGNQNGSLDIGSNQLSPRLGLSLGDIAQVGRALWSNVPQIAEETETFRCYVDRVPQGLGRRDLMSGISLAEGSDARRRLGDPPPGRTAVLARLAQRRRNLAAIMSRSATDESLAPRLLAEVDSLTAELDSDNAARFLYELGWRHHLAGHHEMAADAFARIAERFPASELTPAALAWLVRYYASAEFAWKLQREKQAATQSLVGTMNAAAPTNLIAPVAALEQLEPEDLPAEVTQANATTRVSNEQQLAQRATRAIGYAAQLQAASATYSAEPEIVFPWMFAERAALASGSGGQFFAGLYRTRPADAWRRAAEAEQWLANRSPNVPLPFWRVHKTAEKPFLDGKLDEAVWQSAERVALVSAARDDASWPATALLARDDEYLYVAFHCRKPRGATYTPTDGLRHRDMTLVDEDRVVLNLDLDRDRSVTYRLEVDHRGDVRDRLWNDATWNPTWHVATAAEEEAWICEAAIPWIELTEKTPTPGTAWLVGVERTVPRVGFQSWTVPASPTTKPEGFGLLLFDE